MCELEPSAGCCYREFGHHNGPTPKQGRYGGTASQIKPNLSEKSTPPHQIRFPVIFVGSVAGKQ